MLRMYKFLLVLILSVAGFQTAQANSIWVDGQDIISPYMRDYSLTSPPSGYVQFCKSFVRSCKKHRRVIKQVRLTKKRWNELRRINRYVNKSIQAVSDKKLYGRLEHWTFPAKKGDCEDFVLLKRELLMRKGWPASALLITVVRDDLGEGHAVLTVRTSKGDFILDNKRKQVASWNELPYRYYKWQSSHHPRLWVSLMPTAGAKTVTASRSY